MKSIALLAAGVVVALTGCASFQDNAALDDSRYDLQKVAAINRAAKGSGVTVHWLNYPQRHQVAGGTDVVPQLGEPTGT